MKVILTILTCIFFAWTQKNITIVNSFDAFYQQKDQPFFFVYEIKPSIVKDSYHSWSFNSNDNAYALHELKSLNTNVLVMFKYDPISEDINMATSISSNKVYVADDSNIIFAGIQDNSAGYDFMMSLIAKGHHELYPLLVIHDKIRAFNDYKKMYAASMNNHKKKDLLFWISRVRSDDAYKFLNQKFETENNDLKKGIVFGFRNFGKRGYERLYEIAKQDNHHVSDEARFWIVNSAGKELEKDFSDKIYDEESIKLKESAIFSLYNQNDFKNLKRVAETSKDIRLRKKALFWLGQSNHISIDYFAKLLNLD